MFEKIANRLLVAIAVFLMTGCESAIAPSNFNFNIKNPAGNYVVVDHGNNEFSIFAHLKNGFATVDKGDHVKAGDLPGKVGNSGNTTEPHLHYHMQNTDKIFMGEGVPVQFINYYENGKYI